MWQTFIGPSDNSHGIRNERVTFPFYPSFVQIEVIITNLLNISRFLKQLPEYIFQWWRRKLFTIYESLWIFWYNWRMRTYGVRWLWSILWSSKQQVKATHLQKICIKNWGNFLLFRILFWINTYKNSTFTNPMQLKDNLINVFLETVELFDNQCNWSFNFANEIQFITWRKN